MLRSVVAACAVLIGAATIAGAATLPEALAAPRPPTTRTVSDVDTVHGNAIPDPYRWLEDFESEEAQAWIEAQNAHTDALIRHRPGRDAMGERIDELLEIPALWGLSMNGDRFFFLRRDPGDEQGVLYVRQSPGADPEVLVDPGRMSEVTPVGLDWWRPSDDGEFLAYGLSEGGTEQSTLHVMDVATHELLPERIPDTRGASVAWRPDASGFYYVRDPHPGEFPDQERFYHRRIFYHKLGTDPAGDSLVYEHENMYAWPGPQVSTDGRYLIIYVYLGAGRNDLYVRDLAGDGETRVIAEGLPSTFFGTAIGSDFYMMTRHEASNGKILKVDLEHPDPENWVDFVPESDDVLRSFLYIDGHLVLHYLRNAQSELQIFSTEGDDLGELKLPPFASLLDWTGDWRGTEAYFGFSSYLIPPTFYHYDAATEQLEEYMTIELPVDTDPYVAEQVWYESRDGTPISMFLVHRKDIKLDGTNPTILTGYGGFSVSVTPSFSRSRFVWLERGGVLALPNLRGGGEYGEAWHLAGILEKKQNVFDDFITAAEWLIENGYTSRPRLAVQGGSNGGLLIGAFITQRPELAAAALCDMALLDMVRYPMFYGATIWTPEYGHPDDPDQFEWLYAYSPYHHVDVNAAYPATLLTTAESDTRVHPSHAMKMAARLQAVETSERPVLLDFERRAGHGAGRQMSTIRDEILDSYSFLFWQLGMEE